MLLIVLPEPAHPHEHHVGGLIADGAVGGIGNDPGRVLNEVNGLQGGGAVQDLLDQHCELSQADTAGDALAAGLSVAQAKEIEGHVHRAEARLAGADAPAHVPVQAVQYSLGLPGCLNG